MTLHDLSIVIFGPGIDARNRSHWAFAIHERGSNIGTILQVLVIDLNRLIYQFDERSGVDVRSESSEGSFSVAALEKEQIRQAIKIIREEPAPRDSVERCQDWVLRTTISLEAEEIVPPGTSSWIQSLIGQASATVAQITASRWIETDTH